MTNTTKRFFFLSCLFAVLSASFPLAAGAAENAGNVIAARRQAWAERGPRTDTLASKSPVFAGDTLATNPIGRLQVLFRDDSVLMMAPDTRTTVTEYVYGEGKKPAFGLQLAQGVTRLISGRITEADPEAMRVETAQAVVGIKGTDVRIAARGAETKISLIHGTGKAVEVYSKIHDTTFALTEPGTSLTLAQGNTALPAPVRESVESLGDNSLPLGDGGAETADADSESGQDARQDSSTADAGSGPAESAGSTGSAAATDPAASSDSAGAAGTGTGASVADASSGSQPNAITDTVVVDTASNQDIAQPATPATPAPAPAFSGTYQGGLAGSVSGSQVSGSFTMGIRDIADTPMVSGVSLYVSSGTAAGAGTRNSGAAQELSIYGQGDIAALNSDGSFSFRSDKDSLARLAANNLLPDGYVDVAGGTDGTGISLGLTGNLGEAGADVGISGDGSRISALPPDVLPAVPSITPSFSGRYSGALSGTVAGTGVTGAIHMGIANLTAAPAVSAVSAYVSDQGWAGGAATALSIYGSGTIATLNDDGTFTFTSTAGSTARLDASHRTGNASVTVSGKTSGLGLTVDMTGTLDGGAAQVALTGPDVPKTGSAAPGLDELPAPPAISPSFSGRYSGNIAGTLAGTRVSGQFHMGVRDLANAPTVSAVSAYVSEQGWTADMRRSLAIHGDGTIATLGADGRFQFTSTAASAARLTATGQTAAGYVTVDGAVSGQAVAVSAIGSLDGTAQNIDFAGDLSKTSITAPGLADLPVPPWVRTAFSGRYTGSLGGNIGNTAVTGNFHMGIRDLASTPTVSAISLFASENGWAENTRRALSIYGEGAIASLNANGGFSFTSDAVSTPAQLQAHGLTYWALPGGGSGSDSVTVSGTASDNGISLGVIGSLTSGAVGVQINGSGDLASTTSPSLTDLPAPPAIRPIFSGRYTGSLSGGIAGTPVTGNFHMGIRDLANTPTVNAISLYASEIGWASGATQALSVHGEGNIATLDGSGNFSFKADAWNTPARLRADGLTYGYTPDGFHLNSIEYTGGSVTVSGSASIDGINLGLIGSLDGNVSNIVINGNGSLVSTTPPALNALPTPPAIASDVTGTYRGTLTGVVADKQATGTFGIGINNIAQSPVVSGMQFSLPGELFIMNGNGNLAPVDSSGNFNFILIDTLNIQGQAANSNINLTWDGTALGKTTSGTGSGTKVSTTVW